MIYLSKFGAHIKQLSRQISLTGVICNCHPQGYASFDANENSNQPRRFLAN